MTSPDSPENKPSFAAPARSLAQARRPLHICIASPEFIGLASHCGTGMAYTAMAQALAAAGHQVTCLFLGAKDPSSHDWQQWVAKYQSDGLTLVSLPPIKASELVAPSHLIKSYETYHWLKRNDRFDIIHFPDHRGPGYHTLTAKHHSLAFARTTICVGLHSMTAWLRGGNQELEDKAAEADTVFMERQALALADAVVSPSHYLLNVISDKRWEMPRQRFVQQTFVVHPAGADKPPVAPEWRDINELVYFGALETRKGITVFCDALDAIPGSIAEKIKCVTFLGKEGVIDGSPARNYVQQRAQRWSFQYQITSGLDDVAMFDYLRQKHRLAVIPSLLDNSAALVRECLEAGLAFITSRVGGVSELIAPADVRKVCCEPKPGALCLLLCAVLTEGVRPARAALDARANERAWVAMHEHSLSRLNPLAPPRVRASATAGSEPADLSGEVFQLAIQALSIDLKDVVALKTLARIHLNAGLFEAAQEACQMVLKRNVNDAEARQMLDEAMVHEARLMENLTENAMARPGGEPPGRAPFSGFSVPHPTPAAPLDLP